MSFIKYNTPSVEEKIDREMEEFYVIAASSPSVVIGDAVCFSGSGEVKLSNTQDITCKGKFAGICKKNGNPGEYINLQTNGEFEDNSFNFPLNKVGGKVFYHSDGKIISDLSLINADGLANHFQIIGKILSNKKILIKEEPAVSK